MKIIMKMQTRWNGEVLRPGDEVDIEGEAAHRWIGRGIAEPSTFATEVATADEDHAFAIDNAPADEDILLEDLKYNELRKIAAGKDIKVPRGIKKPGLIALIRGGAADVKPAPTDEKKTV